MWLSVCGEKQPQSSHLWDYPPTIVSTGADLLQFLGLAKDYQDPNSEVGTWLRHIFGLPYLDLADVEDFFLFHFMSENPNDEKTSKFADYLIENCFDGEFPPEMWFEEGSTQEHTTNACEAFHAVSSKCFYDSRPSIWIFLEVLKRFQIQTYIKINSSGDTPTKPTSSSAIRQEALNQDLDVIDKVKLPV